MNINLIIVDLTKLRWLVFQYEILQIIKNAQHPHVFLVQVFLFDISKAKLTPNIKPISEKFESVFVLVTYDLLVYFLFIHYMYDQKHFAAIMCYIYMHLFIFHKVNLIFLNNPFCNIFMLFIRHLCVLLFLFFFLFNLNMIEKGFLCMYIKCLFV